MRSPRASSANPAHPHLIAALDLVLDFNTWRLLVRGSGLSQEDAVELVEAMLRCIS